LLYSTFLVNAIEAIESDKGKISIKAFVQFNFLYIIIKDNGTGISDDNLPRLFEPYFTSKRNGIGLGLASTLNIIQAHKGTIEVSTAPNEGTAFTVILPLQV